MFTKLITTHCIVLVVVDQPASIGALPLAVRPRGLRGRPCSPSARTSSRSPIPGTRNATRLQENVGATNVELTEADLARIREVLLQGSAGSRYPASVIAGFRTD
ncbi:hypothetical protein [Streptomyces sp. NPDC048111]|uniref:hypothetical protein n=1 Tax=Streptomyces sp. NPDC048111 TaxID=3365500 RepID=UPI003722ADEB